MEGGRIIIRRTPDAQSPDSFEPASDLHPVLLRVYRNRNIASPVELDRSVDRLLPPTTLKGIDRATTLLANMLFGARRILIVADFDADGATSCALAVRALRQMGASDVSYIVPNRFDYGYGLTPEIVALAAQQDPDLIITVDNGISSVDGVHTARAQGIAVLVTDHHLPGSQLPQADAIVNPNQAGDRFPSKNLAGVGVIFYVMLTLRARLREAGWFQRRNIPEPNLACLLDLVALGTVADVVPLDHNNRILVAQGLARINRGQCCEGVRALLRVAGRQPENLKTTDLGFCVAPRLNAAGRLSDMSLGIECLLTDDAAKAEELARKLDQLNRERRAIEAEMQQQAIETLDSLRWHADTLPRGICLYDDSWHQGVIGLVASRVKERLHRPVIAFAPANGTELKGSGRSISGLHIRDALDAIAARHPGLLRKFGGHAMAAGLSLPRENLGTFTRAFDEEVGRRVSDDDLQGKIWTDGALATEEMTLAVAELLRDAGPWGQGFPEPVFDGEFEIVDRRVVGERHLKLILNKGDRSVIDAIAFNRLPDGNLPDWSRIRAAYRLDINEYQCMRTLQLILEHVEAVA